MNRLASKLIAIPCVRRLDIAPTRFGWHARLLVARHEWEYSDTRLRRLLRRALKDARAEQKLVDMTLAVNPITWTAP
jgi:hypothetical protein